MEYFIKNNTILIQNILENRGRENMCQLNEKNNITNKKVTS